MILGDIVYGASPSAQARQPDLYGYSDESAWVVERLVSLKARYREHVHFVLGNHGYADLRAFRPGIELLHLHADHPVSIALH